MRERAVDFKRDELIDRAMDIDRDRSRDDVELELAKLKKSLKYFDLTIENIYIDD